MVCLGRAYHFIFFKGCLLQTLLGPFFVTYQNLLILQLTYSWPLFPLNTTRKQRGFLAFSEGKKLGTMAGTRSMSPQNEEHDSST